MYLALFQLYRGFWKKSEILFLFSLLLLLLLLLLWLLLMMMMLLTLPTTYLIYHNILVTYSRQLTSYFGLSFQCMLSLLSQKERTAIIYGELLFLSLFFSLYLDDLIKILTINDKPFLVQRATYTINEKTK
jgi:hypothetical protein